MMAAFYQETVRCVTYEKGYAMWTLQQLVLVSAAAASDLPPAEALDLQCL
jgi:hypothetical protein